MPHAGGGAAWRCRMAGGVDQANDPGRFKWLEDTQVRTVGAGAAFVSC
eukprot:COSAG01_NODE_16844_length_1199_cov_119.537273_2_plen_48_part_00